MRRSRARRRLPLRCAAAAMRSSTCPNPTPNPSQVWQVAVQPQHQPQHQPQPQSPPPIRLRPGGEAPARASPRALDHGERAGGGGARVGQVGQRLRKRLRWSSRQRATAEEEHQHRPSVWLRPRPYGAQDHSPPRRRQHAGKRLAQGHPSACGS